jgi:carboxypeptidase C (cathepsin A)
MLAFLRASAWGAALALSLAAHGAFTTQQDAPGQSYFGNVNYADGLFTPVESLSSLSDNAFTTMGHPFFPRYSVRIKKSQFCDKTVNSYTGYIDIEARHLFFYFFESRNDPAKDDVIFWTNGGPGCSSSIGLFMELGPCRALSPNGTTFHHESWNTNANIFFIDQPIGVGFSYADHGESVGNSIDAAQDVAAFVAIFFENFNQFKGRAFHMAGESYGGRYIPLFASAVYDQNAKLEAAGLTPINLKSAIIGNGMTDPFKMFLSYYDFACTPASVDPVVDIAACVAMKATVKRCEKWMKESCEDQYDYINCGAAVSFCSSQYTIPFRATGRNVYDVSKPCEGGPSDLCYPQTKHIRNYLDRPAVRSLLGVDPSIPANFSACSPEVGFSFAKEQDILHPSTEYVAALLERGIRVLIYVGSYDWICNHVGNERWTLALQWTGSKDFTSQSLRDWVVDGKPAGKTRSAMGFTYATVSGAGHMVPYDKPKESLQLIQRWIAGEEL